MELDELHVGDLRANAVAHCKPIACGYVRVAGIEIDLACPSRGQHCGPCEEGRDLSRALIEDIGAPDRLFARRGDEF